ncbi:uncharacterized protein LOC128710004 [Anopheles marshallii]|uniref:uncharacterized protein LOC128710004 n=1 Tax=Anopheles marshallii TaxID=1521116 RepID=UPI00237A26EB|nr:uncharacterized protein LOC128710004 [Anopheles marshallii]
MSDPEIDNLIPALGNNIPTQKCLQELLITAIDLEADCLDKQQQRQDASTKLEAVRAKIQQAIEKENELKRNRVPEQHKHAEVQEHSNRTKARFIEHFSSLQRSMGISIACAPDRKRVEISFADDQRTKVLLSYNDKGITVDEMDPAHQNIDAIRAHLRETGDLVGFLSVLRKKLTYTEA